jgi:hypothetical protein
MMDRSDKLRGDLPTGDMYSTYNEMGKRIETPRSQDLAFSQSHPAHEPYFLWVTKFGVPIFFPAHHNKLQDNVSDVQLRE